MKAVLRDRYCSPDVLEFRDVDMPVVGDGDVLVRVHAAGVDQGVWHLVTGLPYALRLAGFGVLRPKVRVAGMDVAGRVEAVGRDVRHLKPGDDVFGTCDGSFAEYACAAEAKFAVKPANITFAQAAAIPGSGFAALQALRDTGQVQAGQHVLVIGAGGGVGTFAVQLAKAFGARVTGVCSTGKVDLVRSIGADAVIDYTQEDFAEDEQRYDLVLDTGGNRPLAKLRRVLTPSGTLVIVGAEGGGRWLQGTDRQLRAMARSPFGSQRLRGLMSVQRKEDLEFLRELVEAGTVTPVVGRAYPLREAAAAIRHLRDGHVGGKVVVTA
jgi:NADPH:quinone reductase-like Zn-dependent oxidoreductase